ncbi:DUF2513 domain-containing protein [Rhizobium leguminosarum]|uniref:DUF2513 domain-containing protein n=1 Tax=Rhizobium leguminosarum TaxID=384 RepID=UPI00102F9287|nr:DUF2513 domain-containing protein [Rhizobium leguminosarum]TBG08438.1 DUF2513 domain-containing protein [Rhizobium leguminosarum]
MKRDMDLVRGLLLKLEARYRGVGVLSFDYDDEELQIGGAESLAIAYHLGLLLDAGFVSGEKTGSGQFIMEGMTWAGHEFLDSVRNEEIWKRTQEGINFAGGLTLDLVKGLAKGYAKKKLETLTGIEVML